MQLPRTVVLGKNSLEEVGKVVESIGLNGKKGVLTGKNTVKVAGNKVKEILEEKGFSVDLRIIEEVSIEAINELLESLDVDMVLGVGGGKSIDTAKVVGDKLSSLFISVPTAASHDGIASNRASVKQGSSSKSIEAAAPMAVVADTSIICNAPKRLMKSGCADIISNKTAVLDWGLSERLKGEYKSGYASTLSEMTARIMVKNASSIKTGLSESARMVVKGLISSGVAMSIAGSSRPASGAEHMFSHSLDALAPDKQSLHGEQCGLGSIMTMYLHDGDWRKIKKALKELGSPVSADGLGLSDELVLEALTTAHEVRPERYTILGKDGITRSAAEKVATETGVI